MLVIRRRTGQAILVAGNVEIEVMEVTAGRVKLGIRAPREVPVTRKEVQLTADANRTAASGFSAERIAELARKVRPPEPHA